MTTQSDILAVLRRLRDVEYSEVRIGDSNLSVTLRRKRANVSSVATQQEHVGNGDSVVIERAAPAETLTIDAPMLGTFYGAPRPGEKPFVGIGDKINVDTTVCIIEVMKLMNSVQAQISGVVEDVLVQDGQMVEAGSPLFRIGVE